MNVVAKFREVAGIDTAGLVRKHAAEKETCDRELEVLIISSVKLHEAYDKGTGSREDVREADRRVAAAKTDCTLCDSALAAAKKAHDEATKKAADEAKAKEQANLIARAEKLDGEMRDSFRRFIECAEKSVEIVSQISGAKGAKFDVTGLMSSIAGEASRGASRVIEVRLQTFGVRLPDPAKTALTDEYAAFVSATVKSNADAIAKQDARRHSSHPTYAPLSSPGAPRA